MRVSAESSTRRRCQTQLERLLSLSRLSPSLLEGGARGRHQPPRWHSAARPRPAKGPRARGKKSTSCGRGGPASSDTLMTMYRNVSLFQYMIFTGLTNPLQSPRSPESRRKTPCTSIAGGNCMHKERPLNRPRCTMLGHNQARMAHAQNVTESNVDPQSPRWTLFVVLLGVLFLYAPKTGHSTTTR